MLQKLCMRRSAAHIVERLSLIGSAELRTCTATTAPFCLHSRYPAQLPRVEGDRFLGMSSAPTLHSNCLLVRKSARENMVSMLHGFSSNCFCAGSSVHTRCGVDTSPPVGQTKVPSFRYAQPYPPLRWQSSQAELAGAVNSTDAPPPIHSIRGSQVWTVTKLEPWLRNDCIISLQWRKQHLRAGLMAQMAQKRASRTELQSKQPGMTFLRVLLRLRAHWRYTSRTDCLGATEGYTSRPVHATVVCK